MVWTYLLTDPNATRAACDSGPEEMPDSPLGQPRLQLSSTDSSESSDENDSDYQPQLDNCEAP
uniref:Uncharacterized protein n=1 Tax=Tetranychus urticae TaxID=32264 RepID=T1K079_TETUR